MGLREGVNYIGSGATMNVKIDDHEFAKVVKNFKNASRLYKSALMVGAMQALKNTKEIVKHHPVPDPGMKKAVKNLAESLSVKPLVGGSGGGSGGVRFFSAPDELGMRSKKGIHKGKPFLLGHALNEGVPSRKWIEVFKARFQGKPGNWGIPIPPGPKGTPFNTIISANSTGSSTEIPSVGWVDIFAEEAFHETSITLQAMTASILSGSQRTGASTQSETFKSVKGLLKRGGGVNKWGSFSRAQIPTHMKRRK